jgi:class 3 adenylate cyclase
MTRSGDELALVRRVVAVVDIRSSTAILEDLKQTDNLGRWRNLLIALKQLLQETAVVEPYKFIGDGWVLMFPEDIPKSDLMQFLVDFSLEFHSTFDSSIADLLQRRPERIGLTFGVDEGQLVRLEMNEQTEYLGRAINVAARLQEAAKRIEGSSNYQALLSRNSFNKLPPGSWVSSLREVRVPLRNVAYGEDYACLAWEPLEAGDDLLITDAGYGIRDHRVDVTKQLNAAIVQSRLHILVGNQISGDPAPGIVKDLVVRYKYRGQELHKTVQEGGDLDLP